MKLQFVCGDDLTSDAVAWFSAGHFSHVDTLLDDGRLLGARSDFVGGKPPGVQIRPPNYSTFTRRTVFTLAATPAQESAYLGFLHEQLGKPYDKSAIWGFIFNRDWREPDSWICSELQAAALEHAKLTPPLFLAASKITPVSAALVLSVLGAVQS
jgi:uncharacterized protein YycO